MSYNQLGQDILGYTYNDDGSIREGLPAIGGEAFLGFQLSEYRGVPHGPLSFRWWVLTTTKSTVAYTSPYGALLYAQLTNQTFSGPVITACSPRVVIDAVSGQAYCSLYDFTVPGDATPVTGWGAEREQVEWISVGSVDGNAGGNNLFIGPPFFYTGLSLNLWPAFVGAGWYQNYNVTSIINGVTNSGPGGFGFSGGFPDLGYDPRTFIGLGFTLHSLSATEMVWHRTNATGGTDSWTLTLDTEVDPISLIDGYPLIFPVGQVWICGEDGGDATNAFSYQNQTYVGPYEEVTTTTNYVSAAGKMIVIRSDGSWGLEDFEVPMDGSTIDITSPGNIVIAVGWWTAPTDNNQEGYDLIAEV